MIKRIFPRITSLMRVLLMVCLASWMAAAGLLTTAWPVQAATLTIISSGDDPSSAVVDTPWSRTYAAGGGTAPYSCSMTGTIPGVTFNTTTCTLAGTPSDYGSYPVVITFTDDDENTGSVNETFTAKAETQTELTLTSTHPDGDYVTGFPVWAQVQVSFTAAALASEYPPGTVEISSGDGGPTCSAILDVNGFGECVLIFSAVGTRTVRADYPGDTYIYSSTDSIGPIQIEPLNLPPALSAGRNHTCYLAPDGLMTCWGLEDALPVDAENNPQSLGYFSKISSGGYHTCGLKVDGTIACWGDNTYVTGTNIPKEQYIDISSGDEHVCAIGTANQLKCWGNLSYDSNVVPKDKVTAVSAGVTHDCAILKSNGKPVCWGDITGTPTNISIQAIAVGNTHTCAIKTDGSLACWGTPTMTIPGGNSYTAIESGSDYSCAQDENGTITCWGTQDLGVSSNTIIDTFSGGFLHACALRPSGTTHTLSCWGNNTYGQAPAITLTPDSLAAYIGEDKAFSETFAALGGYEPTLSVSEGSSLPAGLSLVGSTISGAPTTPGAYSFSLTATEEFPGGSYPLELTPGIQSYSTTVVDGTTTANLNLPSQVDAGSPALARVTVTPTSAVPELEGTVRISSADGDTACQADVGADGAAECTLYFSTPGVKTVNAEYEDNVNSLFLPSTATAQITINPVVIEPVVSGGDQFSCSINGEGKLACWGRNTEFQSTPPTAGVYDQLDLGSGFACAVGLNRQAACWGWNSDNISDHLATTGVKKATTGETHACVLTFAGVISCWNQETSDTISVPTATYTDVDAGANHTCAVVDDGSVRCWGSNSHGQTSIPADLLTRGKITRISSGGTFTCGLHESGSLECWGNAAIVGEAPTSADFVDVSAGGTFVCGQKTSGEVACWGDLAAAPASTFTQIDSGADHACGILSDDRMQCWGSNASGQAPAISISPASMPTIDAGAPWSAQISASGGRVAQYSYSISQGSLPPGIILNSNTGAVSGTPTQAGVYSFTVYAQETNLTPALAAAIPYTLTVRGWVDAIIDSALPAAAVVGRPVEVAFSVHAQNEKIMGSEPSGTVTVSAEGNRCEVELVNGTGTCTMLFADPGAKTITIEYPGDDLYLAGDNLADSYAYEVLPFSQEPQLRTGADHTYIYKTDGTVGCIGVNCASDLFTGIFTRFGVGDAFSCGLHTNGDILCAASSGDPLPAAENGPYIDLSVGKDHVCALRLDGQAECWGDNGSGQTSPPAGVFSLLSAGGDHTCALSESGLAQCWGAVSTAPPGAFASLTSGDGHTCGLRLDGTAACWGDDSLGQSTVPLSPTVFSQIAAGGDHTCGLDSAGKVACWGDNAHAQTNPIYGSFIALAADDDHVCALRNGLMLTCWGEDDAGEAPHYSFNPLTDTHIPALAYYEHIFNVYGGTKPLSAGISSGILPPGMDIDASDMKSVLPGEIGTNELSPAGMVVYGIPDYPGNYSFVLKWTDVSPYPLVMEQPYTLTVTGGDLAVDLSPPSPAEALEGLDYRFKAEVTSRTPLAVPGVALSISIPEGLADIRTDHPGCTLAGSKLTCELGTVEKDETIPVWVTGNVTAQSGQTLTLRGSVRSTDTAWPEIAPADNTDSFAVQVALKAEVLNEDFNLPPFSGWMGGTPQSAPNGQTYLSGSGSETIQLDMSGLSPHKNIVIRFDLYIIGPWNGNNPGGSPSEWTFGQAGAPPIIDTSFCNEAGCQQAYPGSLPLSAYPARTRAVGWDELGYITSGVPHPDSRYTLRYKFPHSGEDLNLVFSSLTLPDGASWGLDHVIVELDSGYSQVWLPLTINRE